VIEADAIVLVQITQVNSAAEAWTATASVRGNLEGRYPEREISFSQNDGLIVSCNQMREPEIGRYYVLYLQQSDQDFRFSIGYPYWFARASNDPRLVELDTLLPWGAVRRPTADELRLIEIAEPRFAALSRDLDLSGFTRIYVRRGPSSLTMMLLRAPTPERLMLNTYEERPTQESCGCELTEMTAHLDDLLAAGVLPPFDP
jgi:hypothetical protein